MFTAGGGGGGADGTKFFHFLPHDAVFFDFYPLDQRKKRQPPGLDSESKKWSK